MKELNVFKCHKLVLMKLGIYPIHSHSKVNVFFKSFVSYYISLILIAVIVLGAILIVKNVSEFTVALCTSLLIFGASQSAGMFCCYGINMSRIQAVHLKLQEIVDKIAKGTIYAYFKALLVLSLLLFLTFDFYFSRFGLDTDDNQHAFSIFRECEVKCRKIAKNFFYYGCLHVSTFLIAIIGAFYEIYNGNTDASTWNVSLLISLPLNLQSYFVWCLNWFFQTSAGTSYGVSMILTTSHFVSFCYYIIAACNHFDLLITSLRADNKPIGNTQEIPIGKEHPKIWRNAKQQLHRAIEMHVEIYE